MSFHVTSPLAPDLRTLNIVVLSEGFVAARKQVFLSQVRLFTHVLRNTRPFHRFPSLFTVSALFVPSAQSIAHITDAMRCDWRAANAAGQVPADNAPSPFATAFGALFCRARETTANHPYIPRYLAGDASAVKAVIAAEPALKGLRTAPIVLVDNSRAEGGGAREGVGWFSMDRTWMQVAIHELGHSAFDLADEYDYDGLPTYAGNEPVEPNVTMATTRDALRTLWSASPAKLSLLRWHELMAPSTPAPTSTPNQSCTPVANTGQQSAKPGVPPEAVGLFEGAQYSACKIFRPSLECRMRHNAYRRFCAVCEWAIGVKLAHAYNFMRVDKTATVPGMWTVLASYYEEPSRVPPNHDLGRLVFYAGATGSYEIQGAEYLGDPKPPQLNAPNSTIDAFWTSLSPCEINGLPHFLAHSLPRNRLAIYEVIDDAGKPRLDIRYDSGDNAVAWTHVTSFVSAGAPHMLAYQSSSGRIEISRLANTGLAPTPVSSTALDPTNLWATGYTLVLAFTVDSAPYVLKHNAITGEVHIQSLDPPGRGPNTYLSPPGHWSPGATSAIAYEEDGRTFVHRTSVGSYESLDWVWPGGAGVEVQARRQSLDVTIAMAEIRGKTASGFKPFGYHQVAALDLIGGRVRMMSAG